MSDHAAGVFWWRLPDDPGDEAVLMSLRHAELKCFLVARAIQRDRNKGELSFRQIAERAQLNLKHAHAAVTRLIDRGLLLGNVRPGATAIYRLPSEWRNRTPTGEQFESGLEAQGERHCMPVGEQHCMPTGVQHLEFLKNSESSYARHGSPEQHHRVDSGADDVASLAFARAIEAELGRKLSRSDQAYCAELRRRGYSAETVCAGIAVGRFRKLRSDSNRGASDPIRSLRYFDSCIDEAAGGAFPAGYADNARRRFRRHAEEVNRKSPARAGAVMAYGPPVLAKKGAGA